MHPVLPEMYSKLPNLVFGFHGCDESTKVNVLHKNKHLNKSTNEWDWLGHGVYFWENNLERAYQWADERAKRGDYDKPSVIGAIIDLGHCMNLTDNAYVPFLDFGFKAVKARAKSESKEIPKNKGGNDSLMRFLDCAVIQQIHDFNSKKNPECEFDSVRGIFIEGKEAYPGSGFREKTHVQICIRNLNCIKGYFNPLEYDPSYRVP